MFYPSLSGLGLHGDLLSRQTLKERSIVPGLCLISSDWLDQGIHFELSEIGQCSFGDPPIEINRPNFGYELWGEDGPVRPYVVV